MHTAPVSLGLPTNHHKIPQQSPIPALSQAIFQPALEPALLFQESLIMWDIKVFLTSWYVCGIISLDIQPNFG